MRIFMLLLLSTKTNAIDFSKICPLRILAMMSSILALVGVVIVCKVLEFDTPYWSFAGGIVGAISSVFLKPFFAVSPQGFR